MVYQQETKHLKDFLPLTEPNSTSGWEHPLHVFVPVLGANNPILNEIPEHHPDYLNPAVEVKIPSYTRPIKVDDYKRKRIVI